MESVPWKLKFIQVYTSLHGPNKSKQHLLKIKSIPCKPESLQATINQLESKIDALHSVNIRDTVKSIQDHLAPQYNQLDKSVLDLSVKIN